MAVGKALVKSDRLGKAYIGILLVIFGGIVLHAPLTVALGTVWSDYSLAIKAWKEILMLVAGVILLLLLRQRRMFKLLKEPLVLACVAYAALHLVLIPVFGGTVESVVAGLMIDLRYILFFVLVYLAIKLYPGYAKIFIKVGIAGALVVVVFAILQVFVLPKDILKYLGYNLNTIVPYLTVDLNPDFIRINSTLRGPNPVGAYAVIVLAVLVAAIFKNKISRSRWPIVVASILGIGGLVALWFSYSRSALVAAVVAVGVVLAATIARRLPRKVWIIGTIVIFGLAGGLVAARETPFVSNVILHVNQDGGSAHTSNDGHIDSLQTGTELLVTQPLGAGVGSAGSASLLGDKPLIIENQYLFIAHEVGWLGLILFVSIFVAILMKLWDKRRNYLALGVFASGIGLALIGLLLPVWVDDTTAIIWWGLAAVALGMKR
ncbi:MAG TPA: O-antigen ligase family protein [Candidatus Saccharibacteria bacterium]|nr:O-antigen ligase family protein [Candidatus Saccharibacteria bacterium]HRQ07129.1 O-antigen ligase family protein [Candidatus Saccharibacteria bacterium]